ncbi:MAG: heme exporter protein CcmD [Rickettsiales bacterium]
MQQLDLQFFVTAAYTVTFIAVLLLVVSSVLRARRAKRTLKQLERDEA